MKPEYKMTIGSLILDSSSMTAGGLPVEIIVDLRLNTVNTARLVFHFPAGSSIAPGEPVEIELGEDGTQKVFTGLVEEINKGIGECTVYCQSSAALLVNNRVHKLYEKQTAGDIINDLARIAAVSPGIIEDGITFPVYVLGNDSSLFDHLLHLASRNGYDCYSDVADKLIFAAYAPSASHPFQFGVNIIECFMSEDPAHVSGVEVYGESPCSLGQGTDAYSWLTSQEVKGTAGPASNVTLRITDPTLKDPDSAGLVAESVLAKISKSRRGFVKTFGFPDARLGDAIEIKDMPEKSMNGTYKITGVKHRLGKTCGFITLINFTEE